MAPAAVVLGAAALLTAVPGGLGLAGWTPLAQVAPFRGLLAAGLLVLAALLAASARWARRGPQPTAGRGGRGRLRAVLAGALAVAAAAHVGVLLWRGVVPAGPSPREDGDLVVLSLNTEHGGASAEEVAAAVRRAGADVVALPETPAATAQQVVARLAADPTRPRAYTASTATTAQVATHATSLLVADDLGAAVPAAAPDVGLAAVATAPADLPGPVVAVHATAPVPGHLHWADGTMVARWRQDVPRVVAACTGTPGAVVAGDLNATLDHPGLRDLGVCVDAASRAGSGGRGTWPSAVPDLLAAPIDHVLVDGRTWRVVSADVVDVGDSDHRGLVVHLGRRDPSAG